MKITKSAIDTATHPKVNRQAMKKKNPFPRCWFRCFAFCEQQYRLNQPGHFIFLGKFCAN